MATREELLSGVVKVNNERIDRDSTESGSESEVSGDGGSGEAASPRGHTRDEAAAQGVLSESKENLQQFILRRAQELVGEMEEVSDEISQLEAKLSSCKLERAQLVAERKQLARLSDESTT